MDYTNRFYSIRSESGFIDLRLFDTEAEATAALSTFNGEYITYNGTQYYVRTLKNEPLFVAPIQRRTLTLEDLLREVTFYRRRYGRSQFFCWAVIPKADGNTTELDPYPAVHYKHSTLKEYLEIILKNNPELFSEK